MVKSKPENKGKPDCTKEELQEKERLEKQKAVQQDDEALYFEQEGCAAEASDWRKCPEWSIKYRQRVTPEDVFLQVNKTIFRCFYFNKIPYVCFCRWEQKLRPRLAAKKWY